MKRTREQFEAEIAAARATLNAKGRNSGNLTSGSSDESALKSNYELPYSSLPKIRGTKWCRAERIA